MKNKEIKSQSQSLRNTRIDEKSQTRKIKKNESLKIQEKINLGLLVSPRLGDIHFLRKFYDIGKIH